MSLTCSFKITAGNTFLHTSLCLFLYVITLFYCFTQTFNMQVTFMYSVCLPLYQNIRFLLIFSLAKHFSDQLLRKKNWKWQKVSGLAFNFSEPSCFWCFLRAARVCDCAVLFALCLAGIVTALTWPTSLLTVASVIDNPWGVCLHRSAEVGKHLAHILLSRQQVIA